MEEIIRRKPRRILHPNSYFHIYNRGNHKKRIFHCNQDYEMFSNILQKYLCLYRDISLFAYCLMPNHYHLLLKTGSDPQDIVKLMQRFTTSYVRFFNKKYSQVGHLFQGRYGSKYLPEQNDVIRIYQYIKDNPLEAELCSNPKDYKWLWLSELLYYNFEKQLVENAINSSKF